MKPIVILPLEETCNNSPVPGIRQQHSANNTEITGARRKNNLIQTLHRMLTMNFNHIGT